MHYYYTFINGYEMWEVVEAEKLNFVACHNENRFGG